MLVLLFVEPILDPLFELHPFDAVLAAELILQLPVPPTKPLVEVVFVFEFEFEFDDWLGVSWAWFMIVPVWTSGWLTCAAGSGGKLPIRVGGCCEANCKSI